jgi:UDP-N-acetylmuramoyl-tripeptide--D-alanyl-D-alanine ligase
MKLTLGEIGDWIHAEGTFDTAACVFGYSIDSRTIQSGELFFAVQGERVDGHDFADKAFENGAAAAVVNQRWLAPAWLDEAKLLRVPDECDDCVLDAMQKLAARVRKLWGGPLVGITGSAGKTTTKECVAQVLASKLATLKTEGNLNNHYGVPLTLLRLEPEHRFAVVEMGMNHTGELRALGRIAAPDWGVVSNVAPVHLEHFPEGIDGIAKAKYELIESLPEDGIAFLNGDDARVRAFGVAAQKHAVYFGVGELCEVRAEDIEEAGLDGVRFVACADGVRCNVHLRLMGRHNVMNALAAIAVGLRAGIALDDCCAALKEMQPGIKRGNVIEFAGAKLVNDCYNSNPRALDSMVEALRKTEAKRRIVVAGEMLELGPDAAELHRACGRAMSAIDCVIGVRGLARGIVDGAKESGVSAEFVESPEVAGEWLKNHLREGDVVLLKASRGVRLENALTILTTDPVQP